MKIKRFCLLTLAVLMIFSFTTFTYASAMADSAGAGNEQKSDNRSDPLTAKQLNLKKKALEAELNGKAYGKTAEVARGQFVDLAREGEGMIWTVLGEFSDLAHNTIAEPNRTVNNSLLWVPDFNRQHYLDLLFDDTAGANSMNNFYKEQSSNRFAIAGDVTDWVTVGNHLLYNDNPDSNVWQFIKDSVNTWYATEIAAGKTSAQLDLYLAQFDQYDRYDYNSDGNFDEPDGYIDTFQSVFAGEGEEAGGGVLEDEAIWSHSWYAFSSLAGTAGPDFNKLGGLQIGDSEYWIGKYTIQPENGGVGVFTHEYGHDLGLPDLYDTSGGENGTGFWTLMSSGSWMGDGTEDIGSKSSHMGAWEKFQLGWLNYEVAYTGKNASFKLGPMEFNTKQAQGLFVILPKKTVVTEIGAPYAGTYYYYSSAGDSLDNLMYKSFDLDAGSTISAKVKFAIELDWDYAYLVCSTDNGATWTPIQTNLSTTTDPNGQNLGYGITGSSGDWVDLTADLPAGNVLIGFRYWTDVNTGGFGFMADDIQITGYASDGAEADTGWTYAPASGFHVSTGTESKLCSHYYVAEYRTYKGYDSTLQVGPYFFGYKDDPVLSEYVDHFAYQDGLLINYWDTSEINNQTNEHPGKGLLLPIDAHPQALYQYNGVLWRNRIQTYDSTFTLSRTDGIANIHVGGVLSPVPSLAGASVFNDNLNYYDAANPQGSVINPNTGTKITIKGISSLGGFIQIAVSPVK